MEAVSPEAVRPCLEGLGWSLSQSLRRYAAWTVELAAAGAVATAGLTVVTEAMAPAGGAGHLPDGVAAGLWLAIAGGAVAALRRRDPLRLAGTWREMCSSMCGLARRHPLTSTLGVLAMVLGTLDEASLGAPLVVQQLLQLLPVLVILNLAGLAAGSLLPAGVHCGLEAPRRWMGAATSPRAGAAATWVDPRRRAAIAQAVTVGMVGPVGSVLCAPVVAGLSPRGLGPTSLVLAVAIVAGIGVLAGVLVHRRGAFAPSWALAVAAGGVVGATASAGLGVAVAGCLLGAATGTGMEVGLRLARGQAVLWRHRGQLPLRSGDVVYRLDGREMEITLDTTDRADPDAAPARADQGFLTDEGWRVTQLSASCWEGTKGRAQLLGRRQADLLGVIRCLHPEAPGGTG